MKNKCDGSQTSIRDAVKQAVGDKMDLLPQVVVSPTNDHYAARIYTGRSRDIAPRGFVTLAKNFKARAGHNGRDSIMAVGCYATAARYHSAAANIGLAKCYFEGLGCRKRPLRGVKHILASLFSAQIWVWFVVILVAALCLSFVWWHDTYVAEIFAESVIAAFPIAFKPLTVYTSLAAAMLVVCIAMAAVLAHCIKRGVNGIVPQLLMAAAIVVSLLACGRFVYDCVGKDINTASFTYRAFINDELGRDVYAVSLYGDYEDRTELVLPSEVDGKAVVAVNLNACVDMRELQRIVIPVGIIRIFPYAFDGCISLEQVYYGGTADEWRHVIINGGNDDLLDATVYFYSEEEPPLVEDGSAYDGNYWHWVDGRSAVWTLPASVTS